MMTSIRYVLIIIVLCCVPTIAFSDTIEGGDVQTIAEPILDGILEGFKTNDYEKYSKDFDITLKESVSEKKFIETDRQIENSTGNCQEKIYLGFLDKSNMTIVLWKAKFDKSEDDILIKLVVSKRGDQYFVTGLWFQ